MWEKRRKCFSCTGTVMTDKEQRESPCRCRCRWIHLKKTTGVALSSDVRNTYTRSSRVILMINPTLWWCVTAVWSVHGATCHGCELQQRLCGHFNRHAALQVGLVTFDGDRAALRLDGPHSGLCGLQGGFHWDVLAVVLVGVPTLLGPGTVQQLLTLRRVGNVATSSEKGEKRSLRVKNCAG